MPTYEYKCLDCHKKFEIFQNISEPPIEKCPECKGKVKRLISGGAFSLKGGGWYKDGYSGSARPARGPEPAATDKKTEKKEKKAEVKSNGGKNKPA